MEEFIDERNRVAPLTLGPAQQSAWLWSWMRTEAGLVRVLASTLVAAVACYEWSAHPNVCVRLYRWRACGRACNYVGQRRSWCCVVRRTTSSLHCASHSTLHVALCRHSHCTLRWCRYAVLCIAGIVSSVLGAGYFYFGWALGVPESISAVICIGYAASCHARTKAPTYPVVGAQLQRGLRGASGPHVLGVRPR